MRSSDAPHQRRGSVELKILCSFGTVFARPDTRLRPMRQSVSPASAADLDHDYSKLSKLISSLEKDREYLRQKLSNLATALLWTTTALVFVVLRGIGLVDAGYDHNEGFSVYVALPTTLLQVVVA
eukprot:CAMPEP_0181288834 /NCGR_PEP_ID=MMETSP1101-20121128/554_1 /TAXON_ID=46948 /ORGANISM="Rhodomonas abbreviata, Strain Caron Lab Isolate" /LENGTH=124 /DNA_ID=CAMNT_0023393003 /DNA_START=127 /DNA_END=498 /DNA_ORIENTATION=+